MATSSASAAPTTEGLIPGHPDSLQHYFDEGTINIAEILPDDRTFKVVERSTNGKQTITVPELRDPLTHTPAQVINSFMAIESAYMQAETSTVAEGVLTHISNVPDVRDNFRAYWGRMHQTLVKEEQENGAHTSINWQDTSGDPTTWAMSRGTPIDGQPVYNIALTGGKLENRIDEVYGSGHLEAPYDGTFTSNYGAYTFSGTGVSIGVTRDPQTHQLIISSFVMTDDSKR